MFITLTIEMTASPASSHESAYWATWNEADWARYLIRVIAYVQHNPNKRLFLADHLGSILALLDQARTRSALEQQALTLISLLHPLPSHLGYWGEWERTLRFASGVCLRSGMQQDYIKYQNHLAYILYYTGRLDETLSIGQAAIALAVANRSAPLLVASATNVVGTLMYLRRVDEAEALLNEIENSPIIQTSADDAEAEARIQIHMMRADMLRQKGKRLAQALAEADNAVDLTEAFPDLDRGLRAYALRSRGLILWARGEYTLAAQDYQQAITLFVEDGDIFAEALTAANLGLVYWSTGQLRLAEATIRRNIERAKSLNANWQVAREIGNLGLVYLSQGKLNEALRVIQEQATRAERLGIAGELTRAQGNRGIVKYHVGQYDAARCDLEADQTLLEKSNAAKGVGIGNTYANLSRCYVGLGLPEKARELAEQAYEISQRVGSSALEIIALRCLAECADHEEQPALLNRALVLARRQRRQLDEAGCIFSLAGLATDEQARSVLWEQGVELLREMGATGWLDTYCCPPYDPPRLPAVV